MKTKIQILLFLFLMMGINQSALAVIAYPYPVEIKQANGTKITVILKGDEHLKWAETVDGYSIMRNSEGIFEYATLDSQNDMVPSGILVRNQLNRSATDNQFLGKTKKGLTYSKSQIGMMKSISKMYQKSQEKVFPTTGSRKLVCILIGFTDLAFTKTQAEFNNLFNQVGYTTGGATGSVKDFYAENSYNQLDLTVTVAGPFTASNTMAYYGANDAGGNDLRPRELVTEAVTLADPTVNYADFDNDNDGTVDGVYVIYAGFGEEAGASTNAIWAHAWSITPVVKDGKTISRYSCSSELRGNTGTTITAIGVICHEFGHVAGASDYYDTNYGTGGSYNGTGYWDLMASGSWNNNGVTPAQHNPYTKITSYGWATSTTLTADASFTLNNAEQNSNSFYRINTQTTNEYFLIENRQQHKFDTNIPGHGMLIYHVDGNYISTAGNAINAGSHQGMYPVCASATGNPPATYGSINSAGCPFPGSSAKTSFTDLTTPNSLSWAGVPTNKWITGITENVTAKTVSFNLVNNYSPFAMTLPPTGVSPTGATLNGQVNANTLSTTVTFEYGTTTSYGSTINSTPNTVTGTATTNVTAVLTGLTTNTTYNYRIKAVNSNGTTYGSNMTFTPMVLSLPVTENFNTATLPIGWTTQNTGTDITERWSISNTTNAGGTPYELMCTYMPISPAPGVTRVITPAINTVGATSLTMNFNHFFNDFSTGATIRIQSSTDMVTWTNEAWSNVSGSGDIGPLTESTTISNNLNSPSTYIAFVVEGNLYQFDYWDIDNLLIAIPCTSPTTQATSLSFSAITDNSMTSSWTRGNGSGVMVIARQGSAVNSIPVDGTTYTANGAFGSGTQIGTGNYVVYRGTGTSVNITNLNTGTGIYYSVYEYSTTNCYKKPALTGNVSTTGTCTPGISPDACGFMWITNVTTTGGVSNFNNSTACASSSYTNYSGSISASNAPGSSMNMSLTSYGYPLAYSVWIDFNGNGIFETSERVIANDNTAQALTISNSFTVPVSATPGTRRMRVKGDYYGFLAPTDPCIALVAGETEDYAFNVLVPCAQPTTQATSLSFSAVANTSLTAGWTRGNGSGVLVVARQGGAVDANPVTGTTYTANAAFGSGTQIGTGNYVVYSGTGTSVNLTNLTQGTGYYLAIYEYSSTKCYKSPALTGSVLTTGPQQFTNFQAANIVVGQVDFTAQNTISDQSTTPNANASAVSPKGVLAVSAQASGRVLIWNHLPATDGHPADVIVGKTDFTSTSSGNTQSLISTCEGVCFSPDGNKLIVSGGSSNRILIWNSIPTSNGQPADVVIGQTDFVSTSSGCAADKFNYTGGVIVTPDGKLIVNDKWNNRVLIFNSIPTSNGASANVVIGQTDMVSALTGNAANQLSNAWYSSLSPEGKLLIGDGVNNRVLIYNKVPTTNGAYADNVIGQTDFGFSTPGLAADKFNVPVGVTVSPNGTLAVGEFTNNRVLIFNSIPSTKGAAANVVLGQPDFVSNTSFNGGISAKSMYHPYGINFDLNGRLFVNGRDMHRVMIFGSVPSQKAELALSFSSNSTNLCGGSSVQYILQITNNGPDNATNVIAQSALPEGFAPDGGIIASSGTYNASSGCWTIPSISSGGSHTLIFNGKIQPSTTITAYANIINSEQEDINLTNNAASVTVTSSANVAPVITQHPSNQFVLAGNPGTFSITASGTGLTYQWQVNTGTGVFTNLTNGATYSGVTSNTLNIPSVAGSMNNYMFRCMVSGTGPCIAISNAALLITSGSCTTPTIQASSFSASLITYNSMTINWIRGNGSGVIVVARQGSAVNADPVNGTIYNANSVFGIGTQLGTGNYVVYNGTGTDIPITGLASNTGYFYAIYEYSSGTNCYKTPALTGNAVTTIPCTQPSTQASNITFTNITSSGMTVNWARGNGSGILVVARQGSAVNANPNDGASYTANAAFGNGSQIGTGNYVVYSGTGATITVTGLSNSTNYYYAAFEYSATNCYKTPALTGNATTISTVYCTVNLGGNMSCPGDISAISITGTTFNNTTHNNCSTANNSTYGFYSPVGSNTTNLVIGSTYTINVTTTSADIVSLWIDYNQNGTFEPTEWTQVSTSTVIGTPSSVTFTVPGGALTGQTGLRVRSRLTGNQNGAGDACLQMGSGITEDYTINFIPQVCTITPPIVGTITQPTCAVPTGSVVLSGLPAIGIWTITQSPGGITTTGTGTSTTVTGIPAGTYTFTVTDASGCISTASGNVVITVSPLTPSTPIVGTITQPSCTVATGSVVLSGLPATGTWILTRTPGGTTTNGTGTSTTISGLAAGTYTFKVTNASGCISLPSGNVVINPQPPAPTAPSVGTITQPTCSVSTGSVILGGLPATGTWTIIRTPGGNTTTGTGITATILSLTAGTYTFTVTNASGCISQASANVAINAQPVTPPPPLVGTVINPTCTVSTGSVFLTNLPANGTWTLTMAPNGTTFTGARPDTTLTGLASGTYSFTVTNSSGCTSAVSLDAVISAQPLTPTAPIIGTPTQPTCTLATGGVTIGGLPSTGNWILTKYPGGETTAGTGISKAFTGLTPGTYTFRVTNTQGCTSNASASLIINVQPSTPTIPIIGTITQPKWTVATGSIVLNGLPPNGTWTLTRNPGGVTSTGTGTSTTITGLAAGAFTYIVTNVDGCSSSSTTSFTIYAQPPTPSGLTVTSCNNIVTLNWRKITDPAFRIYRIYGGTTINPITKIDSTISGNTSDTVKTIYGLTNGLTYNFLVTVVDIGGSESKISNSPNAKIKTGVIPKIKAKWSNVLICPNLGDSIKSYQWYKGGLPVSNAKGQYYVTDKKAGAYYVETIDKNGCINISSVVQIGSIKSLSVYPNPASQSFVLKLNDASEGLATISITNSSGTKVLEYQVPNVNDEIFKEIPVTNLQEGVYVVKVLTGNDESYFTKIVVKK